MHVPFIKNLSELDEQEEQLEVLTRQFSQEYEQTKINSIIVVPEQTATPLSKYPGLHMHEPLFKVLKELA